MLVSGQGDQGGQGGQGKNLLIISHKALVKRVGIQEKKKLNN